MLLLCIIIIFIVIFLFCRTVGEIFAVSIAQGGPPPNFFTEWCYNYISTGEINLEVITESDVTDPVLTELIKEVVYLNVLKVHCES